MLLLMVTYCHFYTSKSTDLEQTELPLSASWILRGALFSKQQCNRSWLFLRWATRTLYREQNKRLWLPCLRVHKSFTFSLSENKWAGFSRTEELTLERRRTTPADREFQAGLSFYLKSNTSPTAPWQTMTLPTPPSFWGPLDPQRHSRMQIPIVLIKLFGFTHSKQTTETAADSGFQRIGFAQLLSSIPPLEASWEMWAPDHPVGLGREAGVAQKLALVPFPRQHHT